MVHIDEIEGFTELSKKHQEFLSRYVEVLNGTKAYRLVYTNVKNDETAATNSHNLLRKPKLKKVLDGYYKKV